MASRRLNLSPMERSRRSARAKTKLLPAAIRAAGKKGFYETRAGLEKHRDSISDPTKLAGWLKGQAKRKGWLSPEHSYKIRRRVTRRTR